MSELDEMLEAEERADRQKHDDKLKTQIEKMKKCANCDTWIRNDNIKYCRNCPNLEGVKILRK